MFLYLYICYKIRATYIDCTLYMILQTQVPILQYNINFVNIGSLLDYILVNP